MVSNIAIYHQQFNLTPVICLDTIKCLNSSIWPMDGILTDNTISGENGPGSNGNEGVFSIAQSSKTGVSSSDAV